MMLQILFLSVIMVTQPLLAILRLGYKAKVWITEDGYLKDHVSLALKFIR